MVVGLDEGAMIDYVPRVQMTSEALNEKRENLCKYLNLLDKCHNSRVPINTLPPGVLHRIFVLTVFTSSLPGTATISLSHVCHYWRRSALERPSLWGFVDFGSRRLSALFLKRSEGAPITFSYSARHPLFDRPAPRYINFDPLTKQRFESYVGLFPRLDTLNLHLSYNVFKEIRHLFRSVGVLRIRSLNICLTGMSPMNPDTNWFESLSTDAACLRELTIKELPLPWPIPPHQKLTRLSIIRPCILPTLTQLREFLSHCQALNDLRITLSDDTRNLGGQTQKHARAVPDIGPLAIERLDFPNLTSLELHANDPSSYECLRDLSSYIRADSRLSSFRMGYECLPPTPRTTCQPTTFELAPEGVLKNFEGCEFLSLHLDFTTNRFFINASRASPESNPPPNIMSTVGTSPPCFSLRGYGQPHRQFDHSSILGLIRGMPNIRHLRLISSAWELLTSWDLDVPVLFPRLTTLELCDQFQPVRDCTSYLTGLVDLNLHKLTLRNVQLDSAVLPGVAVNTELHILELADCRVDPEVVATLRERGIEVITDDAEMLTVSDF